jgi:hypothetical protein
MARCSTAISPRSVVMHVPAAKHGTLDVPMTVAEVATAMTVPELPSGVRLKVSPE